MAALGFLTDRNLGSMSEDQRKEFITMIRNRSDGNKNPNLNPNTDMSQLAKDTYIDYKLGKWLDEYGKDKSPRVRNKEIPRIKQILARSTTTTVDDIMTLGDKAGIKHELMSRAVKESGISDVDGVEPLSRLCAVLDGLAKSLKDLVDNLPMRK
jgi:hypothetical protein